jgi:hypothetical protein
MLGPVGAEFDHRLRGQEEGWGGERREVAFECCD